MKLLKQSTILLLALMAVFTSCAMSYNALLFANEQRDSGRGGLLSGGRKMNLSRGNPVGQFFGLQVNECGDELDVNSVICCLCA